MTDEPSRLPPEPWLTAKMSRFPRGETRPELALRSALHKAGFRYRVHYPVPKVPRRKIDVAFTRLRVAVFVDGCFWHGCPEHGRVPTTNADWWGWKLARNRVRDEDTNTRLVEQGWAVVRCWEHEPVDAMFERVRDEVERARRSGPVAPSEQPIDQLRD